MVPGPAVVEAVSFESDTGDAAPRSFASPKSSNFGPLFVSVTLSGFRSRCTMPARCALSSASASCGADLQHFVEREWPLGACEAFAERLAVEQLHHELVGPLVVRDVMHDADVRVREGGESARFTLEAGAGRGVGRHVCGQDLDRHCTREAGVTCAIDLAHAAGTEGRDDFGRAESSAGCECHLGWRGSYRRGKRDGLFVPPAFKQGGQKRAVDRILRPVRILRSDEGRRTGDRHEDTAEVMSFHIHRNIRERQPARLPHQVDDHFIDNPDDGVLGDVTVCHVRSGVVRENAQRRPDARNVVWRRIDQQVDVLRESAAAVRDHGKTANEDVLRPGLVQGATDADEVFGVWCSSVCSVIWVIHASASSKLENR